MPGQSVHALGGGSATIVVPGQASALETLAAREVQRYIYLRTGDRVPVEPGGSKRSKGSPAILIGRKDRALIAAWAQQAGQRSALEGLGPEESWLHSPGARRGSTLVLTGGDDVGTLYAAYRFAEHLGVRFYLHGDVLPDEHQSLAWPALDERLRPLFARRGIQPFHDFPEGPDWWNLDDYLAILGQLPKLRMNFFGLHTYPEARPNAEPTVWIGLRQDVDPEGNVRFSYPASYMNTLRGNWGYAPKATRDYAFGAADLFDDDTFGPDVLAGYCPEPAGVAACNEVFNRTAALLRGAFAQAHQLGIKTCVGTETPLIVPKLVADRLRARNRQPDDRAAVQELYEGIFTRAARAYPLDYYWCWTPEGWTWEGTKDEQVAATTNDLFAAIAAHRKVQPPFRLATCGWVLGPQQDRALFDKVLPQDIAVSCINREVGKTPVDPAFADVTGRSKWAIPWMEDDPALTVPQLWVGRMRRDAADAHTYGCDGLMGIHWRTRVLGPTVAALAQAAWDQSGWRAAVAPRVEPSPGAGPAGVPPAKPVFPPTDDFYRDWARHEFGPEVAETAGAIFARLDGDLPRPADWVDGPGGIKPDPRPWSTVQREYSFVEELAALRSQVRGAGQRERFDYWLNTFFYLRATAEVNCLWATFKAALEAVKAEQDPLAQRALARSRALPARRDLVCRVGEVYHYLLATVSNPGELGTVANWEQHLLPDLLTKPGEELARCLEAPLPSDAQPRSHYRGRLRVIVPTVRGSLRAGEALELKVIVLSEGAPREMAIYSRPLGRGAFQKTPLRHVARRVYRAQLPAPEDPAAGLEYYVKVVSAQGQAVHFPASAPRLNQTVVCWDER
jgi:hypothetical protein